MSAIGAYVYGAISVFSGITVGLLVAGDYSRGKTTRGDYVFGALVGTAASVFWPFILYLAIASEVLRRIDGDD